MRPSDKELFDFYFTEDETPEGYYSITEIAESTGATKSSVAFRMNQLVKQGKAEVMTVRRHNGRGVKDVFVYKIV